MYQIAERYPLDGAEMREIYCRTLEECMEADPAVVALDADLMTPLGIAGLWKKRPERIFNCGIQEANMVGVAAGMAREGKKPFVHTFGVFASRRACDQIYMSCAYGGNSVCIVGSDPGVASALNGGTHAPNEDIAILRACPTMTVVEPADTQTLRCLIPQLAALPAPSYLRLFRRQRPRIYPETETFSIGKAKQLTQGEDAAILACGIEVYEALEAAARLEREGIRVRVLDLFSIKPLDTQAVLAAARETGAIVTAENHNILGGLGSAVAELLAEECPVPMERVGIRDQFGQVGPMDWLMEHYGLTAGDITEKVKRVIARKGKK